MVARDEIVSPDDVVLCPRAALGRAPLPMIRLAAVSYLNARPLVAGLEREPGVSLEWLKNMCSRSGPPTARR